MDKPLNIAIVSPNAAKYSETFIHNHVRCLQGNIHYLTGGYLPRYYSQNKGLSFSSIVPDPKNWFLFKKKKLDTDEELREDIEIYLKNNRIDVILSEYGPSGVEMMNIAVKLSIPLIVHFHGYDAYRTDVLESFGNRYSQLFSHATKIIVVSKHMFHQLQNLGCDSAKLELLVYGIDDSIFFKKPQIQKKYTFVSCGRFVEKKCPLGILQAFTLVRKVISDATLVMIGDGELLLQAKEYAVRNKISEYVKFTGAIQPTGVARYFNESEIFIQHSITTSQKDSEGTPLAIIESAACQLPCVSTFHAGISDFVIHQSTGLLVNECDISSMADYMIELANNPHKRKKMGEAAEMRVIKNYKLNYYTQELQNILINAIVV